MSRREKFYDMMLALGAGLAGLAPIVLLVEIAEWAISGQWPGWSIEDGLMFVGVERPLAFFDTTQFLLDILVSLPLALGLYLGGYLLFRIAINAEERA